MTKALAARCLAGCALAAAAWIFAVQRVRAEHHDAQHRVRLQQAEAAAFAQVSDAATTPDRLRATRRTVAQFETALHRPAGATAVFDQVEDLANKRSVRVFRIEPKGSTQLKQAEAGHDLPPLYADQFILDLAGAYGDTIGLIDDIQTSLGVVTLSSVRVTPSVDGMVRCQLDFCVFRLKQGSRLAPKEAP